MSIKINTIGRLGADSEIREGKNGAKYVTFRLATDEFRNGKNETVWMNVYDYSERGLKMSQYWKKGTMLDVSGIETVSVYQSKQTGEWLPSRDIRAYNIDFVNGGGSGTTQTASESVAATTAPTGATPQPTTGTFTPPPTGATSTFATSASSTFATVTTDIASDDLPF